MPLVGQRPQRLRQQPQLLDTHRQLAGLRLEQLPFGAEHIADIPCLELVVDRADGRGLHEQLDLAAAILDFREARLAHHALRHHAAADLHADRMRIEPLRRPLAVRRQQLIGQRIATKVVRKRATRAAQLVELRAPFGDQLVFVDGGVVSVMGASAMSLRDEVMR